MKSLAKTSALGVKFSLKCRNPDDITFAYNVPVLGEQGRASTPRQVAGNAMPVAKQLSEMVAHGYTLLNLWPVRHNAEQLGLIAREVIPTVRKLVER